jgi:hypothetical protein
MVYFLCHRLELLGLNLDDRLFFFLLIILHFLFSTAAIENVGEDVWDPVFKLALWLLFFLHYFVTFHHRHGVLVELFF